MLYYFSKGTGQLGKISNKLNNKIPSHSEEVILFISKQKLGGLKKEGGCVWVTGNGEVEESSSLVPSTPVEILTNLKQEAYCRKEFGGLGIWGGKISGSTI